MTSGGTGPIRIAAVGDVHVGRDSSGSLAPHWQHLDERADLFLLAGDLTKRGLPDEAAVLARELRAAAFAIPTIAVLGNHDYESDREKEVADILREVGVTVLDGDGTVLDVRGCRVGIAGSKGFGGGFPGAMGSDFGEPEMKAFMRHARTVADGLERALQDVHDQGAQRVIALMHYSPIEATLRGERLEIWPFLGCYYLAEAVDRVGADVAIHGHAHGGSEKGVTPGGVHVRNVAQPVLRRAYALLSLGGQLEDAEDEDAEVEDDEA
jgi:Icc-related predicted phosphoesterase